MEQEGMRYLDGEMTEAERTGFEKHLEDCDQCRRALEEMRALRCLTGSVAMKDPTDRFWEDYWKSVYRRIERKTAWIMIVIGAVMLLVYEMSRFVRFFGEITVEKTAAVILGVGFALLLVSVIRERAHQYKTDRYKDIQR